MIEKELMKTWGGRKKPQWRLFNLRLTTTVFNKIRRIVESGYAATVTEFIRISIIEKLEKTEQLQQKQEVMDYAKKSQGVN